MFNARREKRKKAAIKYLREELKERLEYLNGEPDNLCEAYQAIIDSMQHQLEIRDIIKETHDFLGNEKIGFETLIRAFNFFSDMTQEEKDAVIDAYKTTNLIIMDGINLLAKSLLDFEHQSQLEPFLRLFFLLSCFPAY